jgi:HD-GYP domain-containing protein (c-di-GMP phosphodiesterase class II)
MAERQPSLADAVERIESVHRQRGREFLVNLGTALRSFKLYPLENEQVKGALDELVESARALHQVDALLEMHLADEAVFINKTRLRLALDRFASLGHVLNTFKDAGVGALVVDEAVSRKEWQELVLLLLEVKAPEPEADEEPDPELLTELQDNLVERGVIHITLGPPAVAGGGAGEELNPEDRALEIAKRTYQRSVAVSKEVVSAVRMGRAANVRKMKRAVQSMVDQVLNNEISLVGLTAIRDYDEYTFTHSVNVCIFAIAIGKRLHLGKRQLYDLGVAALLHDVGKSRVPLELIQKEGALTEKEWRMMQSHPWYGVLALFQMQQSSDLPYRGMVTAYEHHMKIDVTGYPRPVRRRNISFYSKIIAVADGFDAATSRRSYQTPIQPDEVLREMWQNRRRGYDPVLVKELVNLVGIYPVGTCLLLDTGEVAVVQSRNPEPDLLNRPLVRVAISPEGEILNPAPIADLAEKTSGGRFTRSIVKVADPSKFSITPGDILLGQT